ncbi:MAG: VCBS repeat-containing protein [Planctomycetota bacterium]|nr:VCBS repeat-containing protein [Planctomycetota bacterium]
MDRFKRRRFFGLRRRGQIRVPLILLCVFSIVLLVLWTVRDNPLQPPGDSAAEPLSQRQPQEAESVAVEPNAEGENPDDPSRDGWQTEVFANTAKHQLEALLKLIQVPSEQVAEKADQLISVDFEGAEVMPASLDTIFSDERFAVQAPGTSVSDRPAGTVDRSQFVESLKRLGKLFEHSDDLRIEVKVVGVVLDGPRATTKQKIALNARTSRGRIEQHATWTAGWLLSSDPEHPQLSSLAMTDFQQVEARDQGAALLADCTQSVLGSQENVLKQILTGYPEQLDRTQDWRYCVLLGTPGLAVADINNDGLEDIYICQETGIPNLLLLQQPDGSVKNVAGEWGVDWIHNSPAAIFADFDNDGDQDIAVVVTGGIIVSSNEGNRFEKKAFLPTADDTRSVSIADFDGDGRLDLYVCVYGPDGSITDRESAIAGISYRGSLYHDATEGGPNSLLHNRGNWQFADATEEMGLGEANHRLTLAASWEDYDNDGDLDLYVANDYAPNSLFRNDIVDTASPESRSKGRFTDVAEEVGATDQANGMSVSWGDHNRDGWMDLYVGNMFSSAGNRITTQKSFKADATEDIRSTLKRFARGNTLLENQGDGTFKDTSESAGVTMGRWAWSSPFVDLNNDGWEDMLIVNGFITGEDKRDL